MLQDRDPRLADAARELRDGASVAQLAEAWRAADPDFARQSLLEYLRQPLNTPGHEPLVKRLFKHFEQAADAAVMAAFLVALDRTVRREWRPRWTGEPQGDVRPDKLVAVTPRVPRKLERHGLLGVFFSPREPRVRPGAALFSLPTRHYLRRRAWRFFRRLATTDQEAYLRVIRHALASYHDDDLASGENLLDSWGFVHIAFGSHPAVEFAHDYTRLAPGSKLSDLHAAPSHPDLWRSAAAFDSLLTLLTQAQAHAVRAWSADLLQREHAPALAELPFAAIKPLLLHADPSVRALGLDLLPTQAAAVAIAWSDWQELLRMEDPLLVRQCAALIRQHIDANSIPLDAAVALTLKPQPALAELGFWLLQASPLAESADPVLLPAFARLAHATSANVLARVAEFALAGLRRIAGESRDLSDELRDAILAFFESAQPGMRAAAGAWLNEAADWPVIRHNAEFWRRLLQTPDDELRLQLIRLLERLDLGLDPATRPLIWRQVLINVHRGNRLKPLVLHEIQAATDQAILRENSSAARENVHLLAMIARSIRAPERRAALAVLVQLHASHAELREMIATALPELYVANFQTVTAD